MSAGACLERPEPTMSVDRPVLSLGLCPSGLYIGLNGRATLRVCPTLDHLVGEYLASDCGVGALVFDLSGCEWVDSTFAGWLLALHRRTRRSRTARLVLTGCSQRCLASLDRMQLAGMFTFEAVAAPAELREVPCATSDRPDRESIQRMLAAHEELAALSESNARTFGPIVAMLRRQLDATG